MIVDNFVVIIGNLSTLIDNLILLAKLEWISAIPEHLLAKLERILAIPAYLLAKLGNILANPIYLLANLTYLLAKLWIY